MERLRSDAAGRHSLSAKGSEFSFRCFCSVPSYLLNISENCNLALNGI